MQNVTAKSPNTLHNDVSTSPITTSANVTPDAATLFSSVLWIMRNLPGNNTRVRLLITEYRVDLYNVLIGLRNSSSANVYMSNGAINGSLKGNLSL